jgi:hypothetical protein
MRIFGSESWDGIEIFASNDDEELYRMQNTETNSKGTL